MAFNCGIKWSANDEWLTPAAAVEIIVPYLRERGYKTVWCPFDMEPSQFVQVLARHGFEVFYSHIAQGADFFTTDVPPCDVIVSNPPYSAKTEVLERLFALGKPFAMLVGILGLFETRRRGAMFATHDFEVLFPDRRVNYINGQKTERRAPFLSVYVCHHVLPRPICFTKLNETPKTDIQ